MFTVFRHITNADTATWHGLVDDGDAHVVAAAVLTNATFLVSLDKKHLLCRDVQKSIEVSPVICNPAELIQILDVIGEP